MKLKQALKTIIPLQYHAAIRNQVTGMSEFWKRLACQILFIDTHTFVRPEKYSLWKFFAQTNRYRVANAGFPVTDNEKNLFHLRNLHAGQRAFILGNGPSLNRCDLSFLKDEITFGVNSIFLNYEKMGFHPTYYVVEDMLVAEDRSEEINHYHGPKVKFFGNYLHYCIQDAPDVVWLNVRVDYQEYANFPRFSTNAGRMIWVGGTVSYLCMQLAYFMGFKEVYLIGFDHSYRIPSDAKLDAGQQQITSNSDDPNHFNPNYFGKGYRWHEPLVERMELSYRRAKQYFEADNRTIHNATVGGQLEVFPRVNYVDLFDAGKQ